MNSGPVNGGSFEVDLLVPLENRLPPSDCYPEKLEKSGIIANHCQNRTVFSDFRRIGATLTGFLLTVLIRKSPGTQGFSFIFQWSGGWERSQNYCNINAL